MDVEIPQPIQLEEFHCQSQGYLGQLKQGTSAQLGDWYIQDPCPVQSPQYHAQALDPHTLLGGPSKGNKLSVDQSTLNTPFLKL